MTRFASPAAPKARRTRRPALRVEQFDERLVPTVTSTLNADVVLIRSDSAAGAGDAVKVDLVNGRRTVRVTDGAGKVARFPAAKVNGLFFLGGAGNDRFQNNTPLRSTAYAYEGNDTLIGGPGLDRLFGGAGDDVLAGRGGEGGLNGGDGRDLFRRDGYRLGGADFNPAEDAVVGLVHGPLTAADLQAKGAVTVSLEGRNLTFSGPAGAGFQIVADWSVSGTGYRTYFTSRGPVFLRSAAGKIPLGSAPMSVIADPGPAVGVGQYRSANLAGILPLDTTNVKNPIAETVKKAGIEMKEAGLRFGIATGEQIRQLDPKAPLADGVPYLYATGRTSGTVTYKGAEYSPGLTATVAFDPSDPAVYFGLDGVPVVERIAVGVSNRGQLAYHADAVPDGMSPPALFGNLYASAAISLSKIGIPFTIEGEQVIDLDANGDGVGLGLTTGQMARLSADPAAINDLIVNAAGDVAVGVNGSIKAGITHGLNIDIGEGSAFYLADGTVAFRGSAQNPLKGTMLDFLAPTSAAAVQGWFNRAGQWGFKADVTNSGLAGLNAQNLHLEGSSAAGSVSVSAGLSNVLGFAALQLSGTVYFDGGFNLRAVATPIDKRITLPNGTFLAGVGLFGSLNLSRTAGGAVTIAGQIRAGIDVNLDLPVVPLVNFNGGLELNFRMTAANGSVTSIGGRGSVWGEIEVGGIKVLDSDEDGPIASASIDGSGITIVPPSVSGLPKLPNLRIGW